VRVKAQYVEGHVPGARNLVLPRNEEITPSHIASFGADKSAAIVIYSHGIDGWRSYKGAKAAVDAGYSNIQWFRGGWAEWLKQQQPVER
jgi:rhodanese-related sulfurtransferase